MLDCPNCHHQEIIGTIFCSECGTQLVEDQAGIPPLAQGRSQPGENLHSENKLSSSRRTLGNNTGVSLYIMDTGDTIPLEGQSEFTLGRNEGGQAVISDIDLTPYNGYEQGVSRLHTSIFIESDHVFATDLGSANGTRINGQEIYSNHPHPLQHGDIITLGKLKIQMLIYR